MLNNLAAQVEVTRTAVFPETSRRHDLGKASAIGPLQSRSTSAMNARVAAAGSRCDAAVPARAGALALLALPPALQSCQSCGLIARLDPRFINPSSSRRNLTDKAGTCLRLPHDPARCPTSVDPPAAWGPFGRRKPVRGATGPCRMLRTYDMQACTSIHRHDQRKWSEHVTVIAGHGRPGLCGF